MWPVSSGDVGGPNGNMSTHQIDVRFYRFCTEKQTNKKTNLDCFNGFFFKCLHVGMYCAGYIGLKSVFLFLASLIKDVAAGSWVS